MYQEKLTQLKEGDVFMARKKQGTIEIFRNGDPLYFVNLNQGKVIQKDNKMLVEADGDVSLNLCMLLVKVMAITMGLDFKKKISAEMRDHVLFEAEFTKE